MVIGKARARGGTRQPLPSRRLKSSLHVAAGEIMTHKFFHSQKAPKLPRINAREAGCCSKPSRVQIADYQI